jgi:hypothetical protein
MIPRCGLDVVLKVDLVGVRRGQMVADEWKSKKSKKSGRHCKLFKGR